jgi:C-terminal region of peptidase_M24
MLDAPELAWLNAYHARVLNEVELRLEVGGRDWLAVACEEIS